MTKPKRGRPPGTPQPPGTGRKPKPPLKKFVRLNITVPPDLYERLIKEKGDDTTMSALITYLLDGQFNTGHAPGKE